MANRWGINGISDRLYFFGLQNHCRWWLPPWNWKTLTPWKKSYNQPRQHIKKHIFANNVCLVKAMVFPAVMYGCESWTIHKAEHWRNDAFELWCLRVPWTAGNQSWIFIGRTNAEAETPILWPPDVKNWLIWKDPDAGKDWRWEKGMTEDAIVGWHHQLNGQDFESTPGVGDGQGGLARCGPRGHKELDTTEWLNWTEPNHLGIQPHT